MKILATIKQVQECLFNLKKEGKTISLVPTMGALHAGHSSLFERAKRTNNISVASIFVNPLQFNDKRDLEKYPRTYEQDIEKLKSVKCDLLFAPSEKEMYPDSSSKNMKIDLGTLDKVMEGKRRPGHFQGVCVAVKKLFDIIEPDKAYFGEKDFQQIAVILQMVKTFNLSVEIITCPTVREADGLAMSSRNMLLTSDERKNASHIPKILFEAGEKRKNTSIAELKKWVKKKINDNSFLQLEYFEIVNSETLLSVKSWGEAKILRACIAVKVGAVRLIDNISL